MWATCPFAEGRQIWATWALLKEPQDQRPTSANSGRCGAPGLSSVIGTSDERKSHVNRLRKVITERGHHGVFDGQRAYRTASSRPYSRPSPAIGVGIGRAKQHGAFLAPE